MSQWKKVRIGDICKIVKGTTGIANAEPGQYPLVVTAEERKTCSSYQFDCEAVCIPLVSSSGHGKKSLKNVHYQNGKFALVTLTLFSSLMLRLRQIFCSLQRVNLPVKSGTGNISFLKVRNLILKLSLFKRASLLHLRNGGVIVLKTNRLGVFLLSALQRAAGILILKNPFVKEEEVTHTTAELLDMLSASFKKSDELISELRSSLK